MVTAIFLATCSFGLAFLLTPLLRRCALRWGWVDQPDNVRKMHKTPVPRVGGVPIVLAYAGSFGILLLLPMHDRITIQQSFPLLWKLLPAALLVFVTGLLDDLVGLKPWQKLVGQALAAGLACFGGVMIQGLAGYEVGAVWGVPLTIIWLVGCTNAFNLIDGVDGVASGVGFLATLTILIAGVLHGDTGLVTATAPLAGALLGFLLFNFDPASIYLGDCGSLWVGFMLGCYGVIWSQKSATVLSITAPLMALCIPLLDMALSIARRFLRRKPIFSADRGHIHHRLLDRGLTPRRVALLLYAASGLAACFSLLQSRARSGVDGLVVALFCGVVWIGIQYLKYQEFGIAARLFRQSSLRSMVKSHFSLCDYEKSLRAADSVEECWRAIRTARREFGFSQVALRLDGRNFEEQLNTTANEQWTLYVPVSESEYVRLTCQFERSSVPVIVAPLVDLLHRVLSAKAAEFTVRRQMASKKAVAAGIRANVQSPSQL